MKLSLLSIFLFSLQLFADKNIDLNATPEKGSVILFDGTHETFSKYRQSL